MTALAREAWRRAEMVLAKDTAVFLAQVRDDFLLLALEPTDETGREQMQRNHSAESTPTPRRVSLDITKPGGCTCLAI